MNHEKSRAAKRVYDDKVDAAYDALDQSPIQLKITDFMDLSAREYRNWITAVAWIIKARRAMTAVDDDPLYTRDALYRRAVKSMSRLPSWLNVTGMVDSVVELPDNEFKNWLEAVNAINEAVDARNEMRKVTK